MSDAIKSLISSGTKLWLDSIDPQLLEKNIKLGATGATSNPIIIADLLKQSQYAQDIAALISQGQSDHEIAWEMTDRLVSSAEQQLRPTWESTKGDDGYVSFELDPLIEDSEANLPTTERINKYLQLAKKWGLDHPNRLIKVPATPAGIASLEDMVAVGVNVNVTLIFSERQYLAARDAVWAGARKRADLKHFKSVFSIFVSRVDIYTDKQYPQLNPPAQGMVGIYNAQNIWKLNRGFWADKKLPLQQEMIFASTGTKKPEDPADKYVAALCGADIQTNPPATNDAVAAGGATYRPSLFTNLEEQIVEQISQVVDFDHMEETLMKEGLEKFSSPQKNLLALIASMRK